MKWYKRLLGVWILAILILTWMPGKAIPKPDFFDISFIDLVVHFGIFTIFSFLLTGSIKYRSNVNLSAKQIVYRVILISLIFSVFTETGQFFIPGRYFQFLDIIMNFLGSLIGLGLFFLKFKFFSK